MSPPTDPANSTNNTVNAASIKIPQFWSNDPVLWFTQVEAQFRTRGISSDVTKFEYLMMSFDAEMAVTVRDILLNPPEHDKYQTLKKAVISRMSVSQDKRLQQLLVSEQLDGRRPSQLLRRMQQLIGEDKSIGDDLLRKLFVQRLPSNVQVALVSQPDLDLDKIASLADSIMDVIQPSDSIHAIIGPVDTLESLRKEVNELKSLLKSDRGRSSSRMTPSRSRSTSRPQSDDELCWFHSRFGNRAKKCREPCKWKSGNEPDPQ